MGKPHYTEEQRKDMVFKVLTLKKEEGIGQEPACKRLGIPYSSFTNWKSKYGIKRATKKKPTVIKQVDLSALPVVPAPAQMMTVAVIKGDSSEVAATLRQLFNQP